MAEMPRAYSCSTRMLRLYQPLSSALKHHSSHCPCCFQFSPPIVFMRTFTGSAGWVAALARSLRGYRVWLLVKAAASP